MKFPSNNSLPSVALAAIGLLTASMVKCLSSENALQLASSSAGRIILHVECFCKDHHLLWHWQGIRREFSAILTRPAKRWHA
jgi:hypothetical protein